jgi:hypothetical protein
LFHIDRIAETTRGHFALCSGGVVRVRDQSTVSIKKVAAWRGTIVEVTLFLSGFRDLSDKPYRTTKIRVG